MSWHGLLAPGWTSRLAAVARRWTVILGWIAVVYSFGTGVVAGGMALTGRLIGAAPITKREAARLITTETDSVRKMIYAEGRLRDSVDSLTFEVMESNRQESADATTSIGRRLSRIENKVLSRTELAAELRDQAAELEARIRRLQAENDRRRKR